MSSLSRPGVKPRLRFYSRNSDTWKKAELADCMNATGVRQFSMDTKATMLARLKEKQRSHGGLSSGQHGQILAIRRESRWIRREKRYARRARLAGIIARSFSPKTCIVRSQRTSLHRAPGRNLPDLPRGTRGVVQHDLERIPKGPLEVASVADSLYESPFTAKRDIFIVHDDDTSDDEHLSSRGASFTCSICGESNERFTPKRCVITENCTHKRDVCTPCLQSHLTARYEYLGWDQLNCPTCKARFDCADLRKWAPKSLYQKYVAFELQRCCENSGANYVRYPLRRKNGIQCDGAGDYDPKYQSFVDCETCGGRYCVECRIEWHAGTSCKGIQQQKQKERRQRSGEQKLSAMFVEKECKRCPNEECGVPIQKTDGCDHMTCFNCKHEFCWQCFADYSYIKVEGNERHADHCPWYAGNLS